MAKIFKHFGLGGGVKKGGVGSGHDGQDPLHCKLSDGASGGEFTRGTLNKRSSAFVTSQSPPYHHKSSGGRASTGGYVPNPELDIRRHSDASSVNSLRRTKTSCNDWSPVHAAPQKVKDSRGFGVGGMIPRRHREERYSGRGNEGKFCQRCEENRNIPERASSVTSLTLPKPGGRTIDPLLRSDYCDPFDLKQQTDAGDLAVCGSRVRGLTGENPAAEGVSSPVPLDDEYSIPYDVKMKDLKLVEVDEQASQEGAAVAEDSDNYSDPYDSNQTEESTKSKSDIKSDTATKAESDGCCVSGSEEVTEATCGTTSEEKSSLLSGEDATGESADSEGEVGSTSGDEGVRGEGVTADDGSRTYDEPWDLYATRRGLENKLREASKHWDGKSERLAGPQSLRGMSLESSTSSQQEYDEPWDRKAREIERNLIVAKSAKEAARMLRDGGSVGGGVCEGGAVSNRNCRIDERTLEDYESKMDDRRILPSSRYSGGRCEACLAHSSSTSLSAVTSGSTTLERSDTHSPKRNKWNISSTTSPWCQQGERVDTSLPLEKQGWFHGSISRIEAESLLRVHRDGSYLVRTSESNKSDFSLSLKSSRGFMHMKIVRKEGQLILGQFSQPFDDIPQMISFFTTNKLPIQGAEHMCLLYPVHNELL